MTFADAAAYDRFMGRYSGPIAPALIDFAQLGGASRVLDVGCGPGALTTELVARLGAANVVAIDPSAPFVAAVRERLPGVEVHEGPAEQLPFDGAVFDAALAQLVVHFMTDPVAGLREMARVTRASGVVAASVWDNAGGRTPLSPFWSAARALDPGVRDESERAGSREGHLVALFGDAGLREVEGTLLEVAVEHATFDEWWEPFTLGVGPAGAYLATLDEAQRARLLDRCHAALPDEPFTITAGAWAARGIVAPPGR